MPHLIKPLLRHPFTKFFVAGGVSTALQLIVLVSLVEIFRMNPIVASAFSYMCGAVCNYFLNYYFTFESVARHGDTLPKFICVVFVGMSVNTITFSLLLQLISLYLLAQIGAVFISLVVNYALHKYWIYR